MTSTSSPYPSCTAFAGHRRLAAGPLPDVALRVRAALADDPHSGVLVYDDATGRIVDLDLRGSDAEILARLAASLPPDIASGAEAAADKVGDKPAGDAVRGRGRPRLGVVAREVTLLPRHWEWLSAQPGGASVALRKLVEEARRAHATKDDLRQRQEAAYRYMSSQAGDLPGFEEATRALFAQDARRFGEHTASWPQDVRDYAARLAFEA
ncbi:DUF2239 family protein [Bordetella genomosp. 13]|uniref:DUF2239 domain-containing protein n=1 Tax=Bordetella genomosp. 13 TaxID=463040 RepID=A0A1W6ZB96_9BORD|nr:DUF2239 family protein [Bordetella genomosp. 13]ARP94525.1 hypothetical protein CAL15_09075 [Bordetella genomosp. 13]